MNLQELADKIKSTCSKYYFDVDEIGENDTVLSLSCRENGDVGECLYSEEDFKNGEKLIAELEEEFDVECDLEVCDEWVLINVRMK